MGKKLKTAQRRAGEPDREGKARRRMQAADPANGVFLSCGTLTCTSGEPAPCEAFVPGTVPVEFQGGRSVLWSGTGHTRPSSVWQAGTIASLPAGE